MKNKNKLFIILIVILLIIFSIFVYFLLKKTDEKKDSDIDLDKEELVKEEEEELISETQKRVNTTREINEIYNKAVDSQDYNMCLEIEDEKSRNNCISKISLDTLNVDLCVNIESSEDRKNCSSRVYHGLAINSNNINACSQIDVNFWFRSCIDKLVKQNDYNIDLCQEIYSIEHREYCIGHIQFYKASINNDCSLIDDPDLRHECLN